MAASSATKKAERCIRDSGARPLRRTLQNEVEDVVAEQMLDGKLQSGDTAHVRLKDDKVVIEK